MAPGAVFSRICRRYSLVPYGLGPVRKQAIDEWRTYDCFELSDWAKVYPHLELWYSLLYDQSLRKGTPIHPWPVRIFGPKEDVKNLRLKYSDALTFVRFVKSMRTLEAAPLPGTRDFMPFLVSAADGSLSSPGFTLPMDANVSPRLVMHMLCTANCSNLRSLISHAFRTGGRTFMRAGLLTMSALLYGPWLLRLFWTNRLGILFYDIPASDDDLIRHDPLTLERSQLPLGRLDTVDDDLTWSEDDIRREVDGTGSEWTDALAVVLRLGLHYGPDFARERLVHHIGLLIRGVDQDEVELPSEGQNTPTEDAEAEKLRTAERKSAEKKAQKKANKAKSRAQKSSKNEPTQPHQLENPESQKQEEEKAEAMTDSDFAAFRQQQVAERSSSSGGLIHSGSHRSNVAAQEASKDSGTLRAPSDASEAWVTVKAAGKKAPREVQSQPQKKVRFATDPAAAPSAAPLFASFADSGVTSAEVSAPGPSPRPQTPKRGHRETRQRTSSASKATVTLPKSKPDSSRATATATSSAAKPNQPIPSSSKAGGNPPLPLQNGKKIAPAVPDPEDLKKLSKSLRTDATQVQLALGSQRPSPAAPSLSVDQSSPLPGATADVDQKAVEKPEIQAKNDAGKEATKEVHKATTADHVNDFQHIRSTETEVNTKPVAESMIGSEKPEFSEAVMTAEKNVDNDAQMVTAEDRSPSPTLLEKQDDNKPAVEHKIQIDESHETLVEKNIVEDVEEATIEHSETQLIKTVEKATTGDVPREKGKETIDQRDTAQWDNPGQEQGQGDLSDKIKQRADTPEAQQSDDSQDDSITIPLALPGSPVSVLTSVLNTHVSPDLPELAAPQTSHDRLINMLNSVYHPHDPVLAAALDSTRNALAAPTFTGGLRADIALYHIGQAEREAAAAAPEERWYRGRVVRRRTHSLPIEVEVDSWFRFCQRNNGFERGQAPGRTVCKFRTGISRTAHFKVQPRAVIELD